MRKLALFSAPFFALLTFVIAANRSVHAAFPGTNGQITFTQGPRNSVGPPLPATIFVANPDGSHAQNVLLPEGFQVEIFSDLVWSPDGTKLLISHTWRLDNNGQCCLFQPATINPDGSNFNLLANGNCEVWSPDETRILCSFPDGVFSVRSSDGGDPVRLTTYPFGPNCNACDFVQDISPDGSRFIFMRFKRENFHPHTQQVAIFVENTDGTNLQQITPYGLALPHEMGSAKFSPDGTLIISTLTNGQLFVVRPRGTDLATIKLQVGTQQYFAFEPQWSPDGTRIIFCMFINGGEGIFTANPDGSNIEQVTFTTNTTTEFFNGPHWGTHPIQQLVSENARCSPLKGARWMGAVRQVLICRVTGKVAPSLAKAC